MIPIRCFTCGKVIAGDYKKYVAAIKTQEPGKVLDAMGYTRYCCRLMMLTQPHDEENILNKIIR